MQDPETTASEASASGREEPPARRAGLAATKRLVTAAVGIPILFFVIKKSPAWITFGLVSVCAAIAAREACALLERPYRRPLRGIAMAGSVLFGTFFLLGSGTVELPGAGRSFRPSMGLILVVLLAATLAAAVLRRRSLPERVEAALGTLFAAIFVGLPLAYLTGLRVLDDEEMGRDLLVLLLVVIWVGDTAAMYAGAWLGRRPLAPTISPRKTIEGAAAGIAAGIGGALLAHLWWFQRLPVVHAVAIGLLLGIVGILGDLAESVLKRAAGAKDSSSILPGHGGMLDRVDSLLFAGPALYYYYLAVLR